MILVAIGEGGSFAKAIDVHSSLAFELSVSICPDGS